MLTVAATAVMYLYVDVHHAIVIYIYNIKRGEHIFDRGVRFMLLLYIKYINIYDCVCCGFIPYILFVSRIKHYDLAMVLYINLLYRIRCDFDKMCIRNNVLLMLLYTKI